MNAPQLTTNTIAKMIAPSGVEKIAITDRASWLKNRERDVTASAAGALFGAHEYVTPYQLYALKSGLVAENPEETGPMRRGRLLEPVALQLLAEERPTWKVERGTTYFRDASARIGATPDAFVVDPDRQGFGIAQIKTVEPGVFRRKWRPDSGAVEAPLWIAIQAIVEASLTGASWAVVTPMVVGFGLDIQVIEIPLHQALMDTLREKVADFWRRVDEKDPYSPDYALDGALIAGLYAEGGGKPIDLSSNNRIGFLCEEKLAWTRRKGNCERALEEVDAEIIDAIKNADSAIHPEFNISRKKQKTGGYTVEPGTTRVLRVTRKKAMAEAA